MELEELWQPAQQYKTWYDRQAPEVQAFVRQVAQLTATKGTLPAIPKVIAHLHTEHGVTVSDGTIRRTLRRLAQEHYG